MFRNSKLSNFKVRKIIWCFCVDINVTKTAILLDLNRNTINSWFNVFRRRIYIHQEAIKGQIIGNVEVDEAYFGATRQRGFHGKLKRGRGTLKQPVFGIFERDGRVYTEIVSDCKKVTLQAVIKGKSRLKASSIVMGGVVIMGLLMSVTLSTFELIMARMRDCKLDCVSAYIPLGDKPDETIRNRSLRPQSGERH